MQRGYNFEKDIVKIIESKENWHARRLGGTSTGLPDIVATNNKYSEILVIEAKSTASNKAYVPVEEIKRCYDIITMFEIYDTYNIILAFKFKGIKSKRVLKYRFFTFSFFEINIDNLIHVTCTYNGMIETPVYDSKKATILSYHEIDFEAFLDAFNSRS